MADPIITVIGGLNIDHIMVTNRLPDRGESLVANSYRKAIGGKGANSSIAIHRSCRSKNPDDASLRESQLQINNIQVRLIGGVGDDDAGQLCKQTLEANGLDTDGIRVAPDRSTGVCFVIVQEDSRDNWLIVTLGANESFAAADFDDVGLLTKPGAGPPNLVVAQLEINMPAIERMLETAGLAGIDILLNPSPAKHVLLDRYKYVTHFLVNETEAALYSGLDVEDVREDSWSDIAKGLLAEGVRNVVITLGASGAFYANAHCEGHVAAFKVEAVDATGAGDTFTGTYASEYVRQKRMGEEWDIKKAVLRACKASALIVCTLGAQEGIPWADEIDDFVVSSEAPTALEPGITLQEGLEV